jgi:hypothetical protein
MELEVIMVSKISQVFVSERQKPHDFCCVEARSKEKDGREHKWREV